MEEKPTAEDFDRMGGVDSITRWVTRFYELIANDPLLAGLFTQKLEISRDKQIAFMIEFFGGPALYSEQHGKAFLRFKHRHVKIGQEERDAWMNLILRALRETVSDAGLAAKAESRLAPLATAMINHLPDKKDAYYFN
ncbi:MAG: hypothetical protein O7A69_00590 [SAR324 cluster bacterium]|nr:hypothetical protein [SAR324 cluster bacterium]MCZ6646945.1 hypothetical protein [SAR324 cluster bacterium]MCZ6729241.1 hypothetical protein [SAR324 cluster bacterium]